MEKTFSSFMSEFMKGISENDKRREDDGMGEKMASMCPCLKMKEMSEEEKKAMMEKMMLFCGREMEMMSSFLRPMGSGSEQTGSPKNK